MAKRIKVILEDGDHWLSTPTPYGVERMEVEGVDPFNMPTQMVPVVDEAGVAVRDEAGEVVLEENVVMTTHDIHAMLAALLTDSEEVDEMTGRPKRIWSSVEAAKMLPWSQWRATGEAIASLLEDMIGEINAATGAGSGNAPAGPKVPQDHKAKKGSSRTRTEKQPSSSTASPSPDSSENPE